MQAAPHTIRRLAPLAALPLGGCAEGVDGVAAILVGLAMLFVLALFVVPAVRDVYERRVHHDRMHNRRPFSAAEAERRKTRKRKDA